MDRIFNPQPGWYSSDFHTHTTCSDGVYAPPELHRAAADLGLDFLTITDHNDIRAADFLVPGLPSMVLPGIEVTLLQGHFNVFGLEGNTPAARELFLPWLVLPAVDQYRLSLDHPALDGLVRKLLQAGAVLSINHPLLVPWEWRDALIPAASFHCMEVINDPTYFDNYRINPLTRRMWSAWLNAGLRVTGIGGSDFHAPQPSDDPQRESRPGLPRTFVYARELSGQAVLEGLRRGHAYTTMGAGIEFWAECGGARFRMGDEVPAGGGPVGVYARVSGAAAAGRARLVADGRLAREARLEAGGAELELALEPGAKRPGWVRLEVVGEDDQSLALCNPVYLADGRQPPAPVGGLLMGQLLEAAAYPQY